MPSTEASVAAFREHGFPRPFWKTIPRFEKSFGIRDLMQSLLTLCRGQKNEGTTTAISTIPTACGLPATTPAHLVRTGREGLYLALKSLQLRPNSNIGVPLFCCACVFEAIVAAGHIPAFLDIDLSTYALDPESVEGKRKEIDALIVVHTFGYPANLNQLKVSLGDRKVPIIEDCAHSLFSEYDGRTTGTWTELSIFSFGLRKPAAAGGGGLLVVNDADLAANAEREFAGLETESKSRQAHHSFRCWGRSIGYQPAAYGAFLASPLRHFKDRDSKAEETTDSARTRPDWSCSRIRVVDLARVNSSIQEFQAKTSRLAQYVQTLRTTIDNSPMKMPQEPAHGKWNHFWVPIRYSDARQRDFAQQFLRACRIDAPAIWPSCVRHAERYGYDGGCKQAEEAAETVCRIPVYSWFSKHDLEYIVECMRMSAG